MREQVGRRCDMGRGSGDDLHAFDEVVSLLTRLTRIPGSNVSPRQCLTNYLAAAR